MRLFVFDMETTPEIYFPEFLSESLLVPLFSAYRWAFKYVRKL